MGDDLSRILETSQAERLAAGFVFTEGPLWHPDGFYYFVDIRQSRLHRITPASPRSWSARTPAKATARRSICRAVS